MYDFASVISFVVVVGFFLWCISKGWQSRGQPRCRRVCDDFRCWQVCEDGYRSTSAGVMSNIVNERRS